MSLTDDHVADARSVPLTYQRAPDCPFDPAPELVRRRAEEPVARFLLPSGGTAWLVTRHADVRAVLSDPRFSSVPPPDSLLRPPDPARSTEAPPIPPGMFVGMDPPGHTRLRRMVTGEFTVKRMARLRPRIERIVAEHLDGMERAGGPVDLMQVFALPIPSLVICELLGVPYRDRDDFQRRSRMAVEVDVQHEDGLANFMEMHEYMAGLVAAQRAEPGDDLLGMLVREHGDDITDEELIGLTNMLLSAGHETTANVLAIGTLLLIRNPEQAAVIRDQPERVEHAVEEMLRYLSVVPSTLVRTAMADVAIGGTTIPAGDHVMVSLQAANRDGERYPDADRFDLAHDPELHVAFGHGIHHCLGRPLARMELQVAFPALLRRFPGLRLAVPFEDIRFRPNAAAYSLVSLPVTW
ncbi:cytochrome P450 [Actinokineospora sp. NPDC004072]